MKKKKRKVVSSIIDYIHGMILDDRSKKLYVIWLMLYPPG